MSLLQSTVILLGELFILEPITSTRRGIFITSRSIFIVIFILGTFQLINMGFFLRNGDLKRARPNSVLRFDVDVFLAVVLAQEMALKYFHKISLLRFYVGKQQHVVGSRSGF
jgi:hypothetical protein